MTPLHADAILECGPHEAETGGPGNGSGKGLGLDLTSLSVSGQAKAHRLGALIQRGGLPCERRQR